MPVPERIAWAVERLEIQPADRLLEIGCGRGVAVEFICQQLSDGHILALDRSATAIQAATQRNAHHVAAGLATFEAIPLEDSDLGEQQFDKVFAINVNLFWTRAPEAELNTIKRALVPSGRLTLFYEPPSPDRVQDIAERTVPRLEAAGFTTEVGTATTTNGSTLLAITAVSVT